MLYLQCFIDYFYFIFCLDIEIISIAQCEDGRKKHVQHYRHCHLKLIQSKYAFQANIKENIIAKLITQPQQQHMIENKKKFGRNHFNATRSFILMIIELEIKISYEKYTTMR